MSVKVAIRVRPFNERQKFLGCVCCVEMKQSTTVLYQNKQKSKKQHYFTFDYSFWSHDEFKVREDGLLVPTSNKYVDQQIVYDQIGRQILDNAWQGYNCCLFAYGQTGAGKSYSMIGYGVNRGIIPMVCDQIFKKIRKVERKGEKEFEITFAMIQIYNEKVQDLFVPTSKRPQNGLKIRENKTLGVYVEGMSKHPVSSYAQIQRKMDEGSKNRSLASTLMNQYSSRAHTIIMLQFIQKEWVTDKKMNKKSSVINLVDLAGSQRVSKTGVGDNKDRLKEASNINKSLSTLGRVIETLAEQGAGRGKNLQVPYRQSSLTRILETALGGNSKTTMICAISPANDNYEETLSTLRYADQTKKIKNKPIVNENAVDKLIRQLREENERLKFMLQTSEETGLSASKEIMTDSEKKQMKINVRASMREIQKEIRKNMQSFAIRQTDQDQEESLLLTEFVDLQEQPSLNYSQLSFDLGNKAQVYITNLNEDQLLNFKIRYSCQKDLLITNKNKNSNKESKQMQGLSKIILCGLGIEQNHAKIFKNGEKYFIQALSQSSADYTLVNGKPVYEKRQLHHNDRIILGTNSVFLFKNNIQSKKDESPNKNLDYEFAVNERQLEMENMSLINPSALSLFSPGTLNKLSQNSQMNQIYQANPMNSTKKLFQSEIDAEMKKKLQDIQKEFTNMIKDNELKTKAKEEEYKNRLVMLKKEKQREREERQLLEKKLVIKSIETEKLKDKEHEITKLKRMLDKYNQEKEKRLKSRESMLIESDDYLNDPNRASIAEEQLIDFIQVEPPSKSQKKPSKLSEIYHDIVIEEVEDNQFDQNLLDEPTPIKKPTEEQKKQKETVNQKIQIKQKKKFKILKIYDEKLDFHTNRHLLFERLYNIKILSQKQIEAICQFCKQGIEVQIQQQIVDSKSNLMSTTDNIPSKASDQIKNEQDELEQYVKNVSVEKQNQKKTENAINEIKESEYKDLIQHDISNHQQSKELDNSEKEKDGSFYKNMHTELKQQLDQILNQKKVKKELKISMMEFIHIESQRSIQDQQKNNLKIETIEKSNDKQDDGDDSEIEQYLNNQKQDNSQKESQNQENQKQNEKDEQTQKEIQNQKEQEIQNQKKQIQNERKQEFQNQREREMEKWLERQMEKQKENIKQLQRWQRLKQFSLTSNINQHTIKSQKEISPIEFVQNQQTPGFKKNTDQSEDVDHHLEKQQTQKDADMFPQVNHSPAEEILQDQQNQQNIHQNEKNTPENQNQIDINISPIKNKQRDQQQVHSDQKIEVGKLINFETEQQYETEQNKSNPEIKENKSLDSIQKDFSALKQHQSGQACKKQNSSDFDVLPTKNRKNSEFGLNLSVSDIQKQQYSQQMSYMNLDGLLKEEDLNSRIRQLENKIKELEQGKDGVLNQDQKQFAIYNTNNAQIQNEDQSPTKEIKTRKRAETHISPTNRVKKNKRKKSLLTDEQRRQIEIQRQLQLKIIQCNNQNIINQRNIQLYKRKRQIDELRKLLFKKQKIQLQKQLLILIPMIRRFNLIAKEMNRLIEARISIEYRNFTHYQMIEALKNYSINKKINGNNIGIGIMIANHEQGRFYRWAVQVFKNRYEIAEQVFQKYLQSGQSDSPSKIRNIYSSEQKSKDPFWDPLDFVQQGQAYLSLQVLLYNLSFQGYISFIWKGVIVAKAYIILTPVKVKKENRSQDGSEGDVSAQSNIGDLQIFNQRNLLEKDLYFNLCVESITFSEKLQPQQNSSTEAVSHAISSANNGILKYYISYTLLEHDYTFTTYNTPELDFHPNKQFKEISYLRRHRFDEISETTLAYLADCPIKFGLHVMKDHNQDSLDSSFCEYDEDGSAMDTSMTHTNGDCGKSVSNMSISNLIQNTSAQPSPKKPDFSKKEKTTIFYENAQIIGKIQEECKRQDEKAKEKARLKAKQQQRKGEAKSDDKAKDKDCQIY